MRTPPMLDALRLMLVTDDRYQVGGDLVEACALAVQGGVTSIQVRLKRASARDLTSFVERLRERVAVPLLINDRADVALSLGASGVHLGPDDIPVPMVRRLAPPDFLIGASVGSRAEVDGGRGADYWGVGPWRTSETKPDAGRALGPSGFSAVSRWGEGRPCLAIGGVRPEDVSGVLDAGGIGVAVVSGILGAADVGAAAAAYAEALREGSD